MLYPKDIKRLEKRKVDTLIGISKGVIADGFVNQKEAEFLLNWLFINESSETDDRVITLTDRISDMLEDGVLDDEEAKELFSALRTYTGDIPGGGELIKPSLPLDDPPPPVIFEGRTFVLTGTFNFGTREKCEEAIEARNGHNSKNVTRQVDYLVIGSYVTSSWKHESYGNKIEKAIEYRDKFGGKPAIISEDPFIEAL